MEQKKTLAKQQNYTKKACDGGEMLGCANLGSMYTNGNGVEKDQIKQLICINKVCDNNIKLCADILFFALDTNQGILEFPKLAQCFWLAAAVKSQGIQEFLKEIASLCLQ